jgi:hypothetical protein
MPSENFSAVDTGDYDGLLLTEPLRFREVEAERLLTALEGRQNDTSSKGLSEELQNLDTLGDILGRLRDLYTAGEKESAGELERFSREPHLLGVKKGATVVFMGYSRAVHRGSLDILAAAFREDQLVLGAEYRVLEAKQMRAGYSFAIRAPDGGKLYLDYTYFGFRKG